jgi:outer membrane usher protein
VIRNENFRSQQVGINPNAGGYTARADNLGPAVVPDLQPYQVSTLRIDAPNLPLGYDVGRNVYHLLPSYRSGTLIRVGTEATVFIRGVLVDAKGEPVSLQAGEIVSLSDPNWKQVTLFTNKAGKFALEGFKPGRYELRLFINQQHPIPFEIPSGKAGVYDLGTLKVPG